MAARSAQSVTGGRKLLKNLAPHWKGVATVLGIRTLVVGPGQEMLVAIAIQIKSRKERLR